MHPAVRAAWPAFISRWEGRTNHMYLDTLRYVTCGVGRKIEEDGKITAYGLELEWRDTRGRPASRSAVRAEFDRIKSYSRLAPKGGHAFAAVATLHLSDAAIDKALSATTETFWALLVKTLPGLPAWPADAQLALLNMAYHLGPGFLGRRWPNFTRAAQAADFAGCAEHCRTSRRTARDDANRTIYLRAAAATYAGLNPTTLWTTHPDPWPTVPSWPTPGPALLTLDASAAAAARSDTFSPAAWYVQRMLAQVGTYTARHDGLFGPLSRRALTAWARTADVTPTLNQPVLAKLSAATLHMPVTEGTR